MVPGLMSLPKLALEFQTRRGSVEGNRGGAGRLGNTLGLHQVSGWRLQMLGRQEHGGIQELGGGQQVKVTT